jgi:hypothetical protein
MFKMDSLYELAKDRHSELLNAAGEARRSRTPSAPQPRSTLRNLAFALVTLTVAAAATAVRVAAAVGGGGGGGPQLMF